MATVEYIPKTKNHALISSIKGKSFGSTPMLHQLDGVAQLVEHPAWLLAWDMGLGKSAVVSYRLRLGFDSHGFGGPILIACPKSVLTVWPKELLQHAGLTCVVLEGKKEQRAKIIAALKPGDILVANYEKCRDDVKVLIKAGFDTVVCDEVHRIKNPRSVTNRAIRKISKSARMRWGLSGTPSPNGPLDIFGSMVFIDPSVLGENWYAFRNKYGILGGYGAKQVVAYQYLDQLEALVATRSSRLLKEDAIDLPEKMFLTRELDLSPPARKVYDALRKESISKLESARGQGVLTIANVLTESMRLLQVCGGYVSDDDKVLHALEPNAKLEMLEDLLEDMSGQQVVIWGGFRAEVLAIEKLLAGRAVVHHGQMSLDERRLSLQKFKGGEAQYFVATPQSAREGLTLTEAATTIFYSRTYNLLDWSQAMDRLHRIGQRRKVTILSLVAKNTVDLKVAQALEKKISLQELILSGGSIGDLL